ncbi:MAG: acyltransferase [Pseudomonadota bacterium]
MIATTPTFANTPEARASAPLSEPHVDYLDGWRGLAIVLVLQSHFLPIAGIDTGQLGVDIFFCLSGLLMSNLLFVKRVPLGTFYKRRISRILPAFVLFVALMYGIAASRGNPRSWTEIVCTLTFLRSYLPAQPDIWSTGLPIGHLWSLNVEEHCYVFLSLLTLFAALRSREVWVLGAASIAAMAVYYIYETSPRFARTSFEIRTEVAASFLLLSAGYFLVRDRFARWVAPWMPLVAVPIAAFGYLPQSHWWMSAIVAPVLLAFSVNHLAQTPALVRGTLASWPWRKMGIWSYSIYLWQQPFYVIKPHLPAGVALLGALLAGLASFYLIEKPSRAWINARW